MSFKSQVNIDADVYPFQHEFLMDGKPMQMLAGGSGIGKTHIAGLKSVMYCLTYPNCRGMAGASTWENTIKIMIPAIEEWLELFPANIGKYQPGHNRVSFVNGSIIHIKNFQKAGRLKGFNLDFCWVDEATEIHDCQSIIEQLENRMRSKYDYPKQIFLTTNPDLKTHYLYKRFYEYKIGEVEFKKESQYVNTLPAYAGAGHLPEEYFDRLKSLSPHRRQMLLNGEWGTLEGQVFFLKSGYHIQNFTPNPNWRFYITYDYGYNPDPMVYLLVGFWQNRYYIIDEISFNNILVGEAQVPLIDNMIKGYPISGFTGDPSSNSTVSFLRKHYKWTYYPPLRDRYDGWIRICEFLEKYFEDTKTSGITFHPRCIQTLASLQSLEWEENKRDVAQGNDHHADAVRYLVCSNISIGIYSPRSKFRKVEIKGIENEQRTLPKE